MNVLPAEVVDGRVQVAGEFVEVSSPTTDLPEGPLEIGVRPEFVRLAESGIPAKVRNLMDVGRHKVLETLVNDKKVHVVLSEDHEITSDEVYLQFEQSNTRLYADGWLVDLYHEHEVE